MSKRNILLISPHSKAIGETYVLPRLIKENVNEKNFQYYLFNSSGEWDDLPSYFKPYIIENPFKFLVRLSPNLEKLTLDKL